MGLVQRNGRVYAYESVREGRRVRSVYVASGELARLAYFAIADRRAKRAAEREAREREREEAVRLDRALDVLVAATLRTASDVLQSAGYHHHRGAWRRRRAKRHRDDRPVDGRKGDGPMGERLPGPTGGRHRRRREGDAAEATPRA